MLAGSGVPDPIEARYQQMQTACLAHAPTAVRCDEFPACFRDTRWRTAPQIAADECDSIYPAVVPQTRTSANERLPAP
jgi:hypothetical protein